MAFGTRGAAAATALISARHLSTMQRAVFVLLAALFGAFAGQTSAQAANSPPSVTTHPASQTVNSGANVTFTAAASGTPTPTVKWQISTDGGATYGDVPNATSTSLTLNSVNSTINGAKVRAVFTNSQGTATTNAATLTVQFSPIVQTNPSSQSVTAGSTATFNVSATGNPTPTVQWQLSTDDGATYNNIGGATSTTLSFTAQTTDDGHFFRAVFTNTLGSATTTGAQLHVLQAPLVTTNPVSASVNSGQTATFTAAASGVLTPQVQWQVSTDGGATFNNVIGGTFTTLSLPNALPAQNGNQYRAVFTNFSGTATSTAATLTVNSAPQVTTSPTNQNVGAGGIATFTAAASGVPTPTVQWQVSTDGGATYNNIGGATSTTLSFTAAGSQTGNKFRAVFTNSVGSATTSAATLTVTAAPGITTNPTSTTINAGQTAFFTAAASGTPAPTVQWQVSTNGGGTFSNISGATDTTLEIANALASQNGNQYRAVFSNGSGSGNTTAATLTVNSAPQVTTNPTNQSVSAGSTATFTAAANGNPTATVQWQVSTDGGGTFNNIAGATSTTLSFTALASMNGNKYRAVFSNSVGSATTTAATLTSVVSTSTSVSSSNLTPLINEAVSLTATVTPTPVPGAGTVTFKEGATVLCANVVLVNGSAACSASFATAGGHNVTAVYSGGENFAGSTSPALTITVTDQRFKTAQVIGNFLSLRNDMLLSSGPDGDRQIDRLLAMQGGSSGSGFTDSASFAGTRSTAGRSSVLGADAGFMANVGGAGRVVRSHDDLDELISRSSLDTGSDAREAQSGFFPTMGSLRAAMSDDGAINASFSTSLSDVMRYLDTDQLGANEAGGSRLARHGASRFDVWLEGHLQSFDDDRDGIDSSGHFGVVYLGADYVFKPWLLVGVLGQYDDMRQTSYTSDFRTEGWGWMAGPYATVRLSPHLFLQGRAAYGTSSNKVSPFLTYSDRFDSSRWLVSSSLTGAWSEGAWQFTPSASLAYVEDTTDSYLDHFSVLIPSVSNSLGQFKAEPEVSYRHAFSDGTLLEPRLKASAIWNFENTGSAAAFGGTLSGPEELRGKVEAGVGIRFNDGISLDISGSYDGIGSSAYDATGVAVSARVPF